MKKFIHVNARQYTLIFFILYISLYCLSLIIGNYNPLMYQKIFIDALTLIGESSAIFILLYNIRHNNIHKQHLWHFLGFGLIFNFIGDLSWVISDIVFGIKLSVPFFLMYFF